MNGWESSEHNNHTTTYCSVWHPALYTDPPSPFPRHPHSLSSLYMVHLFHLFLGYFLCLNFKTAWKWRERERETCTTCSKHLAGLQLIPGCSAFLYVRPIYRKADNDHTSFSHLLCACWPHRDYTCSKAWVIIAIFNVTTHRASRMAVNH